MGFDAVEMIDKQCFFRDRDWFRVVLMAINVVIFAAVLVVVYWLFIDGNPPIEFSVLEPQKNTAIIGGDGVSGTISYHVVACKNTSNPPIIRRSLIDGIVFIMPLVKPAALSAGCHDVNSIVVIPNGMPPGIYDLRITYEYIINPIMTRFVTVTVGPFNLRDS